MSPAPRYARSPLTLWKNFNNYYSKLPHQVMVNAPTGEVQGDRPYSIWKITAAGIAGIALIGGVVLLFNLDKFKHQPPTNPNPNPADVITR